MTDEKYVVEMVKKQIFEVEKSKSEKDPDKKIVTVHLSADLFLKMAYLYVGIHEK